LNSLDVLIKTSKHSKLVLILNLCDGAH